jgi:nanoRNase/pAp phosphatase (c-di-AMP/oligoRNAs hydrolase)
MMDLIAYCKDHSIEQILELPDVKERVELYMENVAPFKAQMTDNAKVYDNVLVVDLRDQEIIYPGNRFVKYALYPDTNISIQVIWGLKQQNTVFTVGKSIFNRSSKVNIGETMLSYGGGGHMNAGTCQVPNERAEILLAEIIEKLKD